MRRLLLAFALLALGALPVLAADAPAPKPRGVHYLYLIRHGAYDRDTTNDDDRVSSGLNALGHEQARLVGERLAGLPITPHALVSSDFLRARQSADDIGRVLRMTPAADSLIHECTPASDRPDYMRDLSADDIALCESNLAAAIGKYLVPTPDADQIDVLVCHGNVIRSLVARALGMDPKTWTHMDIANGSLTILAVRPDGVTRMVTFSDAGHIPVEKQTWTGAGGGWVGKGAGPRGMR
jgi:serine/threonine-protein phosphatase PGAM5